MSIPQDHWTHSSEGRESFLSGVNAALCQAANHLAGMYGLPSGSSDDAKSTAVLWLVEMMGQDPAQAPPGVSTRVVAKRLAAFKLAVFGASTPGEAAKLAVEGYFIRELVRLQVRRGRRPPSRRAMALDGVEEPAMPADSQARLMEFYEQIWGPVPAGLGFTKRERRIFVLETARRCGLVGLDEPYFTRVASMANPQPSVIYSPAK
jgi:hypothetical protein